MSQVAELVTGTHVIHLGERWQITAIDGMRTTLTSGVLGSKSILISSLLADPGFGLPDCAGPQVRSTLFAFQSLDETERSRLIDLSDHMREMLTGYRSGDPSIARPGEPRPDYFPDTPKMTRYAAKAHELDVSVATVRRMAAEFRAQGPSGLVDRRSFRGASVLGRTDPRWIEAMRTVLAENVNESQIPLKHLIRRARKRVRESGEVDVIIPSRPTAYRRLETLGKGKRMRTGDAAKQKLSVANRPDTPYRSLVATRVGQYILLDTTPLDVLAKDPLTGKFARLELTIAMDLASRCIVGLRLSPISTKAVDVSLVLFETICPNSRSHTSGGILQYGGVPDEVYVAGGAGSAGLPGVAPETIVIDHGKPFMSKDTRATCDALGIGIRPARVMTPTDKAQVERQFLTLRTRLLAGLREGYKGPDVNSRGHKIEGGVFYYPDELEAAIRDWIVSDYHKMPVRGLSDASIPGRDLSPNEMWEIMAARSGTLLIPMSLSTPYAFLPAKWCPIHHYGVEFNKVKYDGPVLDGHRNTKSEYAAHGGAWPIRYDPDDSSRAFFEDPETHEMHTLWAAHATERPVPFSHELRKYARELVASDDRHFNEEDILDELFARWDRGEVLNQREQRMALRMRDRALHQPATTEDARLAGDAKAVDSASPGSPPPRARLSAAVDEAEMGDDNADGEVSFGDNFSWGALEVLE